METVRLGLQLSADLHREVRDMADEQGVSLSMFMQNSIALLVTCHQARREGKHVGLVDDPSRLDTEIVW